MRKWMTIFLLVAFGFVATPAANAYTGTLKVALKGETPSMDPHLISNFIGTMIWRWSYDTLVSAEAGTGKHLPWLAVKWKIHSPTKAEFWLRKDAKFTDGTPVTSEAVKFSMERITNPANKSRQRPFFREFDRIQIVDDHHFFWINKAPNNALLNRIARFGHIMNPKAKDVDNAVISRNTYGSGPYILKQWDKGRKMVFEANPTWWGNDLYPNRPKTVEVRRIREETTRVKALEKGEVDVIIGVLPQFIPEIKKNPELDVASVPAVRIMFLTFVTTRGGPFTNRKVRLAVNYAVDAKKLLKNFLGGLGDVWGSLFHPWNFAGYNPNDKWYGYDLEKAKALMKEAGYPNGFKSELFGTIGRYPADKKTCEAIAGMLKGIKIDTTCRSMNYTLWRRVRIAYQKGTRTAPAMFLQAYGNGGGEPANITRATSSCKGHSSNHCFKDVDAAIDKASETADPQEQQKAFEAVTKLIKEKAMHKILYKIHDVFGYKKKLGFKPRHDETFFAWEIDMKKPGN